MMLSAGCSVNFEFLNYTIITSQCKAPKYPADRCCSAFTDFACPYADVLNDLSNDCASTMFSYINLYGNYPPGLFASECRGGKQGLECPAASPSALADDVNGSRTQTTAFPSPLQMLAAAFLVLLLQLLWTDILASHIKLFLTWLTKQNFNFSFVGFVAAPCHDCA